MGERDEKKRAMDLAIAQIEKEFANRLVGCGVEVAVEGTIGGFNAQLAVEDEQRFAHCLDGVRGVIARGGDGLLAAFERLNVHQCQHRTVDLVV